MTLSPEQEEEAHRHAAVLRDAELNAIADKMFQRFMQHMELVGWDMSSPQARAEIADDNRWVRSWRKGSTTAAFTAAGVGVTAVITGILWLISNGFKAAIAAAKAVS